MARIRSIHPGFFTDEELVCVSMAARLLFLGLGTQADDKGIFEWKPLTLKMRIFPADNADIDILLAELEHANAIRCYEIEGRKLGAIRNFRKFQKPKTPNDIYLTTPEIRIYVGLAKDISEIKGGDKSEFPQKGEKSFQMEDGGGKREDGESLDQPSAKNSDVEPRAKNRADHHDYVFSGKVIRLNRTDFEEWAKAYHSLDLRAELTAADAWIRDEDDKTRKRWFIVVSNLLAKKHREQTALAKRLRDEQNELPIA